MASMDVTQKDTNTIAQTGGKFNIECISEINDSFAPTSSSRKGKWIYVLELTCGKYYVGRTGDLKNWIEQHKKRIAAVWTTKYSFVRLVEVKGAVHSYDEDNKTKEYMKTYGISNVRGGAYSSVQLSE